MPSILPLVLLLVQAHPAWLRDLENELGRPQVERMVEIPGGQWQPIFAGTERRTVAVEPFHLDPDPVTNAEYLGFVRIFFNYRRGRISKLLADDGYLAHWASPTEVAATAADQPVTNVSWFAARAYCVARGAHLPTEAEWEYAANAGETQADGSNEPGFTEKILAWYASPAPSALPAVGHSRPNYFGARDLHGLVWEWVLDFNGTFLTSDARAQKNGDLQTFCGAGALGFSDSRNYAAFMRAAFRSSLSGNYTAKTLGFRCARSDDKRSEQ